MKKVFVRGVKKLDDSCLGLEGFIMDNNKIDIQNFLIHKIKKPIHLRQLQVFNSSKCDFITDKILKILKKLVPNANVVNYYEN